MGETRNSKASIKLSKTVIDPHTFYIGFLGMILYREGGDSPYFQHSYSAYAEDFDGLICLTGLGVESERVFDYMQVCERFARSVGREMKRFGVTSYEIVTGSSDTGIVFDSRFGGYAYLGGVGAKMDTIPERGIEWFKKTLEEYLYQ